MSKLFLVGADLQDRGAYGTLILVRFLGLLTSYLDNQINLGLGSDTARRTLQTLTARQLTPRFPSNAVAAARLSGPCPEKTFSRMSDQDVHTALMLRLFFSLLFKRGNLVLDKALHECRSRGVKHPDPAGVGKQ